MKIFLLLLPLLLLNSCYGLNAMGCTETSLLKIEHAKTMYDTWGTSIAGDVTPEIANKMFGCYYRTGDTIYSYKTLWSEKFILVRYGEPLTYYEGDLNNFKNKKAKVVRRRNYVQTY